MASSLRFLSVLCLVLFTSTLMSGCGTTTDENASLAGRPLQGSQARLKIYRASEFVAAVPSARVKVDGRQVAELGLRARDEQEVRGRVHQRLGARAEVHCLLVAALLERLEPRARRDASGGAVVVALRVGARSECGARESDQDERHTRGARSTRAREKIPHGLRR